jgi:multidrug efflux pump subunit AcrB
MRLPELAIRHAPFTVVVFIALMVLGTSAFLNMSRQEDPIILVPGAVVYFAYPGAQALDLEELILDPVEQAINELDKIRFIRSRAENGLAVINVEFEYGLDPDQTYNDVVEKVNSIDSELPEGIAYTRFRKKSNNNTVMLQLALVGPEASYRELEDWGEVLHKRLRRVDGVKLVELRGLQKQEVQVQVNPAKLSQIGIGLPQLAQVIQAANLNLPGGGITLGQRQLSLQTSGSFRSLDEIRNTVVTSFQNNPVTLGQIAEVKLAYPQERYLVRMNGQKAIFITVVQQESSNIFQIQETIGQLTEEFSQELPPHIRVENAFQQAEIVEERINGFLGNLLQGIVLVGLVILLALGGRSSLIVMLAIPFSLLIGLGAVYQLGFGLQQMTIAALVVALGLLVDNSIAIVENIERFLQMGYSRREAAIAGTRQLAWPISSATATTLLAFFPLVMMPEKAGDFLKSMPLTVMATLAASLLIALSLTPLIARHFLNKTGHKRYVPPLERVSAKLIHGPYVRVLRWVLQRPWLSLGLALLLLAGSLAMIPQVGLSFFPKAERPQFLVRIQTGSGSQLSRSDAVCQEVESILADREEIAHFASNIGRGNARVYYNVYENSYEANYADVLVQTHRYEEEEFQALVDELRAEFAQIPEAEIRLVVFEQGIVTEAPIEVRLTGDDTEVLKALSMQLEPVLEGVAGLIQLDNPLRTGSPMFQLNIDKEKAGLLGVSLAELDQTLRISVAGREVARYQEGDGYVYPIRLQLAQSGRFKPEDLQQLYVRNVQGRSLPLSQIAELEFSSAPSLISHYDLERYTSLTADVDDAYLLDEVVSEVESRLEAFDWPAGYSFRMAGERELRNETFGGMGQAAIIAVLLIFGVLVLQFQSFLQPLIIYTAIPLAAIGSIWALYFAGLTFSLTAVVGMISLIGIVINDSIVLVDFANRELQSGKSLQEALISAGQVRFMPIILTSLTTIGGLIPLTIKGGSLWAPMSTVMIGGLIASTFLILVIVPVLYTLFTRKNPNPS